MPAYFREHLGIDGILQWAREWGAHGIIGQFYHTEEIQKFTRAGIPVLAQDFKERFTDIPNITGDYHEAGRIGAEYFLKKGFSHFAFYGFQHIVWSRERAEGFEERLRQAGHMVHYYEHNEGAPIGPYLIQYYHTVGGSILLTIVLLKGYVLKNRLMDGYGLIGFTGHNRQPTGQ